MSDDRVHSSKATARRPGAHAACLGLGSNLRPEDQLRRALTRLRRDRDFEVVSVSTAWQSLAIGTDASDYLNAVVLVRTRLSKEALVDRLKAIEDELGRTRSASASGPVAIDLDLLLFDGGLLEPDLWDLAYRSVPGAELLPDLAAPGTGETLARAARRLAAKTTIRPRPEVLASFGGPAAAGDDPGHRVAPFAAVPVSDFFTHPNS